MFDNIKLFKWKDLNGKTLKIQAKESSEGLVVYAKDVETDKIYIVENKPKLSGRSADIAVFDEIN
jgi:hypothetical protein